MARAVTESALMAAFSFVLFLASSIPVLGAFFTFFCTLPLTYVALKHGLRRAILSCGCTCVLLIMVGGGPAQAYLFLMVFGLNGLACGWMLKRDEPPVTALIKAGTAISVLGVPMVLLASRVVGAGESVEVLQAKVFAQFDQMAAMINDPNVQLQMQMQKKLFEIVFFCPVVILFMGVFPHLYVNHVVTHLAFRRLNIEVKPAPHLQDFRLPPWVPAFFMSLVLMLMWMGPPVVDLKTSLLVQLILTLVSALHLAGIAAFCRAVSPQKHFPAVQFAGIFAIGCLLAHVVILYGMFDTLQVPQDAPTPPADVNSDPKA